MKAPEIYTAYSPEADITFIMRDTYTLTGEPESTAVVGWYYGEPNEPDTKYFCGKLTATY